MKLASLKTGGHDGTLIVVSNDLMRAIKVTDVAPTMQYALDHWEEVEKKLATISQLLNAGEIFESFHVRPELLMAPLPRAYQRIQSFSYLNHLEREYAARREPFPEALQKTPLLYLGSADHFTPAGEPFTLLNDSWGVDCEAGLAAITNTVPAGVTPEDARKHIKLLALHCNIVLRRYEKEEFDHSKAGFANQVAFSLSPFAISPNELGDAWDGGKIHMPLSLHINNELFGRPDMGMGMSFDMPALISHAARTRSLSAGTVVYSGPVSNRHGSIGATCIAERRMIETTDRGQASTPYLKFGDQLRIDMQDSLGNSIFGALRHTLQSAQSEQKVPKQAQRKPFAPMAG